MNYIEKSALLWLSVLKKRYPDKSVSRWNLEAVSAELKKLVKIDNLTEKQVFDISVFATNDKFWLANAKSPFQLRKKSKSDPDFKKWEHIKSSMERLGKWQEVVKEQLKAKPIKFRDSLGRECD